MASLLDRLKDDAQKIEQAASNMQKNLNKRLDGLYFRVVDGNDFDTEQAGDGHYDEQITFVIRDEDTIELWKGDVQVSSSGGGKKRAAMYAIDPNGWDFALSDNYRQTTTTHGNTYVITPTYNDNGLLIGGPYIVPFTRMYTPSISGQSATFDANYYEAIWLPNTNLDDGNDHSFYGTVGEFEINAFNRITYNTFAFLIQRTSEQTITEETVFDYDEYICFRIFAGAMFTNQAVYYSKSGNEIYDIGVDTDWNTTSRYTFHTKPCIEISRYAGSNPPSGYSSGQLIQKGYAYITDEEPHGNGSNIGEFKATFVTSWLSFMGYGLGLWSGSTQQNSYYNKEYGGCGLCAVIGSDVDTEPYDRDGVNWFSFKNNIRPHIGVICEDAIEKYGGVCSNYAENQRIYILDDSPIPGKRLGFDYDLATGAPLNKWALKTVAKGTRDRNAVFFDILKRKIERTVNDEN